MPQTIELRDTYLSGFFLDKYRDLRLSNTFSERLMRYFFCWIVKLRVKLLKNIMITINLKSIRILNIKIQTKKAIVCCFLNLITSSFFLFSFTDSLERKRDA